MNRKIHEGKFVRYMKRTALNKIWSVMMIGLGCGSMLISDDATFLVMMLMIAVPLFFAKENWIG